jgi:hypothetical protein
MKLEVDITVYKRRISPLRVTLEKITIKLGDKSDHSLSYFPEPTINFAKFKRDPGRIIRELNRGADNLRIEPNQGFGVPGRLMIILKFIMFTGLTLKIL